MAGWTARPAWVVCHESVALATGGKWPVSNLLPGTAQTLLSPQKVAEARAANQRLPGTERLLPRSLSSPPD